MFAEVLFQTDVFRVDSDPRTLRRGWLVANAQDDLHPATVHAYRGIVHDTPRFLGLSITVLRDLRAPLCKASRAHRNLTRIPLHLLAAFRLPQIELLQIPARAPSL